MERAHRVIHHHVQRAPTSQIARTVTLSPVFSGNWWGHPYKHGSLLNAPTQQTKRKYDVWHIDNTVYPKKYAHGFCFFVLCCGYTLTDFPISIRLTSLALWQSNDCPSASKATQMNMDQYFMWIHYERLHNHNKAKHNKTVCIFLGIYCISLVRTCSAHLKHTGVETKWPQFCWRCFQMRFLEWKCFNLD